MNYFESVEKFKEITSPVSTGSQRRVSSRLSYAVLFSITTSDSEEPKVCLILLKIVRRGTSPVTPAFEPV